MAMTGDKVIANQKASSGEIKAMEKMLSNSSDSYYKNQEAQLTIGRDDQIKMLEQAYADAVADGAISVRQAEDAFEKSKKGIDDQAYINSEQTSHVAQDRGISNSQQMLAMQQGDQSRKSSMINENVTTRDMRLGDISDRLNSIKQKKKLDTIGVHSNFNQGLLGARGQADMMESDKQFQLKLDDYKMNREQQFQVDMGALQNQYQLDQMGVAQDYTLEQFAVQNGYDLNKMSIGQKYQMQTLAKQQEYTVNNMSQQQKYTLQQFAVQHGYDLTKMSIGQKYQLAQMATQQGYNVINQNSQFGHERGMQSNQFGHDKGMQSNQFGHNNAMADKNNAHASGMQSAGFSHDNAMFNKQTIAKANEYDVALNRELKAFKPGTSEYKLREFQLTSAKDAVFQEEQAKLIATVGGQALAQHLGNTPKHPGSNAKKSQIESYNKQVDSWNNKFEKYMSNGANASTFMSKLEHAPIPAKQKASMWQKFVGYTANGMGHLIGR